MSSHSQRLWSETWGSKGLRSVGSWWAALGFATPEMRTLPFYLRLLLPHGVAKPDTTEQLNRTDMLNKGGGGFGRMSSTITLKTVINI